MENKIESIRCSKCNSIMVLQRSSDADFILHSSRYHYKCSKTKCFNYCVKIFSPSITRSHEMNKQLIGTMQHLITPTLALQNEIKGITMMKNENNDLIGDFQEQYNTSKNKVILRYPDPAERVKIEIEFDVNAIVRLTQDDIRHALSEMFEQIDLIELTSEQHSTLINNFKCQIWKQSL